jgi:hypothetical protein
VNSSEDGTMTLDEWAKQEKEHIERFVAWWKIEQTSEVGSHKEMFPDEMPPGDWDEQFRSWAY